MADLVLVALVQVSTTDCGVQMELVDRTEEGSEDDAQVSGAIFHHTQSITGKGLANYDSYDDEDDALM